MFGPRRKDVLGGDPEDHGDRSESDIKETGYVAGPLGDGGGFGREGGTLTRWLGIIAKPSKRFGLRLGCAEIIGPCCVPRFVFIST